MIDYNERNDKTAHALQEIPGKNDWRDGSSNVSRKQTLTMPTVDVQRQSVPQSGSSDRKSSIADGWKTGALANKRWCRCRWDTLTSLVTSIMVSGPVGAPAPQMKKSYRKPVWLSAGPVIN